MRVIFALALLLAATYAIPSPEISFTEDTAPDTIFLESSSLISTMKKKGATEADCKNLADTSCKEVESENRNDQRVIDRLASGSKCNTIGVKSEKSAIAHYNKVKKTYTTYMTAKKTAHNARVNLGTYSFSSLRPGKCRMFFTHTNYLRAKKNYNRAVLNCRIWVGRTREAKKRVEITRGSRIREQRKCHCATKKTRNSIWRTLTKSSRISRQAKAHAKCKMMKCILKNVSITNKQCRGGLKALKYKKLNHVTENTNCKKPRVRSRV